jgi:hypothetical protein
MSIDKAGWIMGFALFLGACNGLDCGEGRERTFSGIRESSVVYWRERYLIGNKPETVEHNVCMQLCYEASPDAIPRFGDCRDLQLDGGTAGAPGTGGRLARESQVALEAHTVRSQSTASRPIRWCASRDR